MLLTIRLMRVLTCLMNYSRAQVMEHSRLQMESIAWISSDIGKPVDGRWVFYGIMLFNSTQSESLSLLNNSFASYKGLPGTETDYTWILK